MQIAVVGTGYVGLVAGACLADLGNDVVCIDVDQSKIDALNAGKIPIYEPGLAPIVARNIREERLSFVVDGAEAISKAKVAIIAVGTPSSHDGSADLKFVCAVADVIGENIAVPGVVVVCKSTVPIGTNMIVKEIVAKKAKVPFFVASNPEFLKEGDAIEDFMKPDRIVVGSEHPDASKVMDEMYRPLVRTGAPIIHMDIASAELTKYAANSMLATRISFMNEIANLCSLLGADVANVRRGIGTDRRIGKAFLFPGVGFGGSCFPKDVRALAKTAARYDYNFRILDAVQAVNDDQKGVLAAQVKAHFGSDLSGKKLAVWGLAFKARTDDMREAPSIVIINELLAAGATVTAYDPEARETAGEVFGDTIEFGRTPYATVAGADALLVVTDWAEFRTPDFERVKAAMADDPVVFDGRNLYDPEPMREMGFVYFSIGRGKNPA